MKKNLLLLLLGFFTFTATCFGQDRYFDEIFDEVKVTSDVTYGRNVNLLPVLGGDLLGLLIPDTLKMDVYEPEGDDMTDRPVAIYLHTGSFLPAIFNGGITGTKVDYTAVETCTQLAKRGFVAISMDYRLGWNPLDSLEEGRRKWLLQAAYRGIQDVRTGIRYLHKSVAEDDNPFGVDPNKVAVLGQGTGGYIAFGAATLDNADELQLSEIVDMNGEPYVDVNEMGNVDGLGWPNPEDTTSTTSVLGMPTPFEIPFNYPNHIGYPSDCHLVYSFGGALGTKNWTDENSVPMIAAHVPTDPFAPYVRGNVIVPTTGEFVITVDGPGVAVADANAKGVNDVLLNKVFNDPYSEAARAGNQITIDQFYHAPGTTTDDLEGLFSLNRPQPEAGPWDFWDENFWNCDNNANLTEDMCAIFGISCGDPAADYCNLHPDGLENNPDMSLAKSNAYIDTIVNFFIPRCIVAMDLPGADIYWNVGVDDLPELGISIAPNPSDDFINVIVEEETIQGIEVFDLTGKLIKSVNGINANQYTLNNEDLNSGLYMLKIRTENHKIAEKVMVR